MKTVLIVDHHLPDHRRYRDLLPGLDLLFCANMEGVRNVALADTTQVAAAIILWQPAGAEIVAFVKRQLPDTKIVAIDETLNGEIFKLAQKLGATEFLMKPLDESLTLAVQQALGEGSLAGVVYQLQKKLVGNSREWRLALETLARVLPCGNETVLITGETGTGKELAARAIHDFGRHSDQPFVAINAAAVQPQLLESELFGHEKGAFTDAKDQRKGVFEECAKGTLFFDEIGELPEQLQAKLLRVIQERAFRRLGGTKDLSFDGRLVLATNKDLEVEVRERRFRSDLLHRIKTHRIYLPPLRERRDDWLLLAGHFLEKHRPGSGLKVSPAVRAVLSDCEFTGNARQLEHAILHCLSHRPIEQILPGHLPSDLLAKKQAASDEFELVFPIAWLDLPQKRAKDLLETTFNRQYLPRILTACHGNVTQAAKRADMDPNTFRSKWKDAGLPPLTERL